MQPPRPRPPRPATGAAGRRVLSGATTRGSPSWGLPVADLSSPPGPLSTIWRGGDEQTYPLAPSLAGKGNGGRWVGRNKGVGHGRDQSVGDDPGAGGAAGVPRRDGGGFAATGDRAAHLDDLGANGDDGHRRGGALHQPGAEPSGAGQPAAVGTAAYLRVRPQRAGGLRAGHHHGDQRGRRPRGADGGILPDGDGAAGAGILAARSGSGGQGAQPRHTARRSSWPDARWGLWAMVRRGGKWPGSLRRTVCACWR